MRYFRHQIVAIILYVALSLSVREAMATTNPKNVKMDPAGILFDDKTQQYYYIVRRDDILSFIAQRLYGTVRFVPKIAAWNGFNVNDFIYVDQHLVLKEKPLALDAELVAAQYKPADKPSSTPIKNEDATELKPAPKEVAKKPEEDEDTPEVVAAKLEPESEPEAEPASVEAAPEPLETKAELVAVQPESVETKLEPVAAQPESTETKSEPVAVQPEAVATQPEPVAAQPEPVAVKPEPAKTKPEPVAVKPEPAAAKPEAVAAKPTPAVVKPEPATVKCEPTATKSELAEAVNALSVATKGFTAATKELTEAKHELTEAKDDLHEAQRELTQSQRELTQSQKELTQSQKELTQSQKELTQAKKEITEASKEITEANKEITGAKKEISEAKKELTEAKKDLNEAKKDLVETQHELSDTRKELTQAKRKLAEIKKAVSGFDSEPTGDKQDHSTPKQKPADSAPSDAKKESSEVKPEQAEPELETFDKNHPAYTYEVQEGEYLGFIATKLYGTIKYVPKIMEWNGITDDNLVVTGTTLLLLEKPILSTSGHDAVMSMLRKLYTPGEPAVAEADGKTKSDINTTLDSNEALITLLLKELPAEAAGRIGVDLAKVGEFVRAVRFLRASRQKEPANLGVWFAEMQALAAAEDKNQLQETRHDFTTLFPQLAQLPIVSVDPQRPDDWAKTPRHEGDFITSLPAEELMAAGQVLMAVNEARNAALVLRQSRVKNPELVVAWIEEIKAWRAAGATNEERETIDTLIKLRPDLKELPVLKAVN